MGRKRKSSPSFDDAIKSEAVAASSVAGEIDVFLDTNDYEHLKMLARRMRDAKDSGRPLDVSVEQVTKLLAKYEASMSHADQLLFYVLTMCEAHCDFGRIAPLVYGAAADRVYTDLRRLGHKLYTHATLDSCLRQLDAQAVWHTLLRWPLHLGLTHLSALIGDDKSSNIPDDAQMYDVRYLLTSFIQILTLNYDPPLDLRLFVDTNALSLSLAMMSSQDTDVRALAYTVVHKYTVALKRHTMVDAGVRRRRRQAAMALAEAVDSAKMPTGILSHTIEVFDPHQYLYTLRLLRDSMTQSNQRLSCITSHFFARLCKLLLHADDPVYATCTSFITLKPQLQLDAVPEFLKLFMSTSIEHFNRERIWILTLIADGVRSVHDVGVIEKWHVFEHLLVDCASVLSRSGDGRVRTLLFRCVKAMLSVENTRPTLIARHNMITWLHDQANHPSLTRFDLGFVCDLTMLVCGRSPKIQKNEDFNEADIENLETNTKSLTKTDDRLRRAMCRLLCTDLLRLLSFTKDAVCEQWTDRVTQILRDYVEK